MERQQNCRRRKGRKDPVCGQSISGAKQLEIESGQKSW